MATTETKATAKRVKGGSFLIEERLPQDIFTPEDFSEEHRQIAKTAVEFTTNEVMPAADEIEAKNFEVTRRLLRKAGELGLMGVDVPEAYGGLEMDKVTSAIIAESHEPARQFLRGVQRARRASARCPSSGTAPRSRKKSTCRSSRPVNGSAPTRFRNPLGFRCDELPHTRRAFRLTANTTSSMARRCGSPTAASPTCSRSSPRSMARSFPRS